MGPNKILKLGILAPILGMTTADPTPEHLYVAQAHAYLLECTLATYEGLCSLKRPSKAEIRRHKSIITDVVTAAHPDLVKARKASSVYNPRWRNMPRVDKLLKHIEEHSLIEPGVMAYFLSVEKGNFV